MSSTSTAGVLTEDVEVVTSGGGESGMHLSAFSSADFESGGLLFDSAVSGPPSGVS